MRVCVDFDGTITTWKSLSEIGEPQEGVRQYLQEIKNMGFEIAIHTCRTSSELYKNIIDRREQFRIIKEYMEKHDIPYDEILITDKPIANFYIDDSAIRYEGSWKDVVDKMKSRIENE